MGTSHRLIKEIPFCIRLFSFHTRKRIRTKKYADFIQRKAKFYFALTQRHRPVFLIDNNFREIGPILAIKDVPWKIISFGGCFD